MIIDPFKHIPPAPIFDSAVWTGGVNVSLGANGKITKTGGGTAWNAGAYSIQEVASGGIEFKAEVGNVSAGFNKIIGISNKTTAQANQNYSNIQVAVFCFNNQLYRSLNGSVANLATAITATDFVGVRVTNLGDAFILKNDVVGNVISGLSFVYPLVIDCSIENVGGFLESVEVKVSEIQRTPASFAFQTLTTQNLVGTTENPAGTYEKTAANNTWGNAGFSSVQTGAGDFAIRYKDFAGKTIMFGLSNADTDQGFASIKHALFINGGGLNVYENGSNKLGSISAALNDVYVITRTGGGIVRSFKNNALIYTSEIQNTGSLLFDVALYQQGFYKDFEIGY